MSKRAAGVTDELPGEVIEFLSGASLVLDAELRVRLATPGAHRLLGFEVPIGALAPRVLCGDARRRPVAEALAAGRPIEAVLPRPSGQDEARQVRVRSVPLPGQGDAPGGWLLLLEERSGAGSQPVLFHGMWTQEPRMKEFFRVLTRTAATDVTVLVRGETGAGKELAARAIHALSPRREGPFVAINCAALPGALLESELFGHVKGAFTGAHRDTPGHMQQAHRGTLFLDEVAELPLELQAKLLRVLETRSVLPVGAREPTPVDIRIVSATHRSLRAEVEAGRFRADLMYRLRVIPLFLPPLRERQADLPLLCERLCGEMNATWPRQITSVAPAAMAALQRHDWPGNIRELKNVLAYAYAIGDGPTLQAGDLPSELFEQDQASADSVWVSRMSSPGPLSPEKRRLLEALERAGGNRERAARVLGLSRVTLWRRMKHHGLLDPDDAG